MWKVRRTRFCLFKKPTQPVLTLEKVYSPTPLQMFIQSLPLMATLDKVSSNIHPSCYPPITLPTAPTLPPPPLSFYMDSEDEIRKSSGLVSGRKHSMTSRSLSECWSLDRRRPEKGRQAAGLTRVVVAPGAVVPRLPTHRAILPVRALWAICWPYRGQLCCGTTITTWGSSHPFGIQSSRAAAATPVA